MISKQRAEEMKARWEAATEGPWEWLGTGHWTDPAVLLHAGGGTTSDRTVIDDGSAGGEYKACITPDHPNAIAIAHARTDHPETLTALEEAMEAIDLLLAENTRDIAAGMARGGALLEKWRQP